MMKILYVTTWYPTPDSPVAFPFVARDVAALSSRHSVTVVHLDPTGPRAPETARSGDPDSPDIVRIGFQPASPTSHRRARALVQDLLPQHDILHTAVATSIIAIPRAVSDIPWAHTEHWTGLVHPSFKAKIIGAQLRRPDVAVAVSSFTRNALQRYRPRDSAVIWNIADADTPVTPWNRPPDTVRLIAIGALVERKGPEHAIRTLRALRDDGIDTSLTWVGDGPLRGPIEALVSQLGLEESIVLKGSIAPEQVGTDIDAADIFFLPTQLETANVACTEALIRGKQVVIGAPRGIGGPVDFAGSPHFQIVNDPTSVAENMEALQAAITNLEVLDPSAIALKERPRFSSERFVEEYTDLYFRLLRSKSP